MKIIALYAAFFIAICASGIHGYILRLPCLTYGNFSVVRTGHRLSGHVFATFFNMSADECENQCIKNRPCNSINTRNSVGANCELNSKSTEDYFDNVMLSGAAGWVYRTTNYTDRNIGHYCQYKKPCDPGMTCTDSCSCPGYQCQVTASAYKTYKSCQEAYESGQRKTDVYFIHDAGLPLFAVRCDMEVDGGGWMVFQRRVSASTDFYRGWNDYKSGFGNLSENYWLGFDKLEKLAGPDRRAILRIDLRHITSPNLEQHAKYNVFEISNESEGYKLKISGFTGNSGPSLHYHNGMKFSTKDKDNDEASSRHCAEECHGAWWYKNCLESSLNSIYPTSADRNISYMTWIGLKGYEGGVVFSEMKIKYRFS